MPITLDDLTVNFESLDRETLLSDWRWLIGEHKLPILLPCIGNVFVQDADDGSVHLLDVGTAEIIPIADTFDDFKAALGNREFVMNFFAVTMVVALRQAGKNLQQGQIYSFKQPLFLGGEYALENVEVTDIAVHFSVTGQIAQQVNRLPPGTQIEGISIS